MMSKLVRGLIGVIGLVSLLGYLYQIVSTWLFRDDAVIWFAEVAVYALTWAMRIACSELVRIDGHIRADFLVSRLSLATQRRLEIFNCIVGLGFAGLMIRHGWTVTADAYAWDDRSPTGLAFPLWIYYSAAPVCGALLLVRYVQRLRLYMFRFDPRTMMIAAHSEDL